MAFLENSFSKSDFISQRIHLNWILIRSSEPVMLLKYRFSIVIRESLAVNVPSLAKSRFEFNVLYFPTFIKFVSGLTAIKSLKMA